MSCREMIEKNDFWKILKDKTRDIDDFINEIIDMFVMNLLEENKYLHAGIDKALVQLVDVISNDDTAAELILLLNAIRYTLLFAREKHPAKLADEKELMEALQKCANVYGKWERENMDANEAIGWVGNHTRAAGFKPKNNPTK